jgi:arylsulfatase A-like enzyme
VKPHTPWYVPAEYFDFFPPDRVKLPPLAADETVSVPKTAKEKQNATERELARRRNEVVTAYLAAMRYADDCVGRILDGLEAGPNRANTIVLVFGDNGYQFGEKNNWSKGGLWEGSANVPLVIARPGIADGKTSRRRLV